jgi:DNA-binding transcriptional LysR family regulator
MVRNDRYKDIQLPQLRSFCVAATEASFTAAARRLGLSTPTVWQQVRALEQQLQTTLMRRHGRNIELTDEGRLLLEIVQPHVNGIDSLESLFASRQRRLPPEITAAATPYLASSHLLKPLRAYTRHHPSIRLKLRVFVWVTQVVQLVEQGQADVGVVFQNRKEPRSSQIHYEYLQDLPLSLITPVKHPLARKRSITPSDWVKYPLIVPPEGAYARHTLDHLLELHDLRDRVRIVMETPLLDSIRQYVAAGLGIALVHIGQQKFPGIRLHVRPLTNEDDSVCVTAITRRGSHLSPPVEEFRETLRRFVSGPVAAAES